MTDLLITAIADIEEAAALELIRELLDQDVDPMAILATCREGLGVVGSRYESGDYFVSDLIMAGEILRQASELLGSKIMADTADTAGSVVIGTVKGDVHNIGKDIVVSLLQAANYDVRDLGVDVPASRFVDAVKESDAKVVGLSGLLTLAFDSMKETVAAFEEAGLRSSVKVMIGGGPVSEQVREYVGADALGHDAQAAVTLCNRWIKEGAK